MSPSAVPTADGISALPATVEHEVVELASDLIRIDSTNVGDDSSVGERAAAEYVVERLADVGYEPYYVESGPRRANAVVRIPGADPRRGALLLHSHLDVVAAEPAEWSRHPLSGEVEDGCVWGRGAVDRKGAVAVHLALARHLRRSGSLPPRIPERHTRSGEEHLRLLAKQGAGCSFFVTQVTYDVNAAKNLVSDYHVECTARGVDPAPIVFTFTVVGSMKTLEFLTWLGVDVPRWIQNELQHSDDVLTTSYDHALACALDLIAYCRRLGIPFGLNVESVSSRRAEIEQAVQLAARLRLELHCTTG